MQPSLTDTQILIVQQCDQIKEMLLAKNRAYGNSAITPMRVFSKATPIEQINVRMDDKLSRIVKGQSAGEDPELDLIGYLILKRVAQQVNKTDECSSNNTLRKNEVSSQKKQQRKNWEDVSSPVPGAYLASKETSKAANTCLKTSTQTQVRTPLSSVRSEKLKEKLSRHAARR